MVRKRKVSRVSKVQRTTSTTTSTCNPRHTRFFHFARSHSSHFSKLVSPRTRDYLRHPQPRPSLVPVSPQSRPSLAPPHRPPGPVLHVRRTFLRSGDYTRKSRAPSHISALDTLSSTISPISAQDFRFFIFLSSYNVYPSRAVGEGAPGLLIRVIYSNGGHVRSAMVCHQIRDGHFFARLRLT
jgi:hypothetical protein